MRKTAASAEKPGLGHTLLRVALAAGLTITAAGCKAPGGLVRITESPKMPARVGIDKVAKAMVLIRTPNAIDLNTGKPMEGPFNGNGLVVSAGGGNNAILTSHDVTTSACKGQELIFTGSNGVVQKTGPKLETPRKPTDKPQAGKAQAVIVPNADINFIEGTKHATKELELGDSIYILGYGGADPRTGGRPTLVSALVADINNNPREAVVVTGFDVQFDGPHDLYVGGGDAGAPAVVEEDGEYRYVGAVFQTSSKAHSLSEISKIQKLDDVKFELPDGEYGVTIVDLVGGPEDIGAMVTQAKACTS